MVADNIAWYHVKTGFLYDVRCRLPIMVVYSKTSNQACVGLVSTHYLIFVDAL